MTGHENLFHEPSAIPRLVDELGRTWTHERSSTEIAIQSAAREHDLVPIYRLNEEAADLATISQALGIPDENRVVDRAVALGVGCPFDQLDDVP